jgi:periplasmic protein TonB
MKIFYIYFLSIILNFKIVNAQKIEIPSNSAEKKEKSDTNVTFTQAQLEAEFPSGASVWKKFLQNNLNANVPVNNKAPKGRYTVVVRFILYKDGTISDVTPETMHGYGMEAEVVRVIKGKPTWTPASQNEKVERVHKRQSVIFIVE